MRSKAGGFDISKITSLLEFKNDFDNAEKLIDVFPGMFIFDFILYFLLFFCFIVLFKTSSSDIAHIQKFKHITLPDFATQMHQFFVDKNLVQVLHNVYPLPHISVIFLISFFLLYLFIFSIDCELDTRASRPMLCCQLMRILILFITLPSHPTLLYLLIPSLPPFIFLYLLYF